MPTRLKQIACERDSATLARGTDTYGHFDLEPLPKSDFDPDMVALHKSISDRQSKILYRGTDKAAWE
jgi:hypothetical protein